MAVKVCAIGVMKELGVSLGINLSSLENWHLPSTKTHCCFHHDFLDFLSTKDQLLNSCTLYRSRYYQASGVVCLSVPSAARQQGPYQNSGQLISVSTLANNKTFVIITALPGPDSSVPQILEGINVWIEHIKLPKILISEDLVLHMSVENPNLR